MKIAASALQFAASHAETRHHEVRERLRMWTGERPGGAPAGATQVDLSAAGSAASEADAIEAAARAVDRDPMLSLLRAVVEALIGRRLEVFDAVEVADDAAPQRVARDTPTGFAVEYDRHESLTETEALSFAADGIVRTADGLEIRFSVKLDMTRAYHEESDLSLRLGNARKKDPLVVNFAGNAAQLSSQRFRIDLDADGSVEEAHFLAPGSGFLVLDRNGDGKINDGRELFGTRSGDGFADLAALDGDGNGWIDEADEAYGRLQIWSKTAEGQDQLVKLAAADVGAVSLGHLATPFALRDDGNRALGDVRSTGIYLRNDGSAGTVQQVDLVV